MQQDFSGTLRRIDYASVFGFTRLLACSRAARQPEKLLLAMLLIISCFILGRVIDEIGLGGPVVPGEFARYASTPTAKLELFDAWQSEQLAELQSDPEGLTRLNGAFDSTLHLTITLFGQLITAAVQLKPGLSQLSPYTAPDPETVFGALRSMLMTLPGWLWNSHKLFLLVYGISAGLLLALLGGAISRQAMVEAATGRPVSATDAVRFAWHRWFTYIFTPMLPLAVVGGGALLLAIGGLLIHVPVINVLGGLVFFLALAIGALMALLLIGWFMSFPLMYPAISAEGTDAFDAAARAYSYVIARPWRMMLNGLIALVHGAITYLMLGLFIFLTIYLTHWAAGSWVGSATTSGGDRLIDAMLPPPIFGDLKYQPDYTHLTVSQSLAARLALVWVYLLIGVLGAYAISYFFSAYAVIYLELRQLTDGNEPSEIYREPPALRTMPAEKLEPHPAVQAMASHEAPDDPDLPDPEDPDDPESPEPEAPAPEPSAAAPATEDEPPAEEHAPEEEAAWASALKRKKPRTPDEKG